MIGSSKGGVNIEDVAKEDPSAIITIPIDIKQGLQRSQAEEMAKKMGFQENGVKQTADLISKLYGLFLEKDCNLLEINPLAEDSRGTGKKIVF